MGLVLLLALSLRVYDLGEESYWGDEIMTLRAAGGDVGSILGGGRPPVHILLVHLWIRLVGTGEAATRSLSVLFGMGAILMLYVVGRDWFDKNVGLLAALLMAVSRFQIYYSQELRYYGLWLLFALVVSWFYRRIALQSQSRFLPAYSLTAVLLFYTHYYGVFLLATHNLDWLLAWHRQGRRAHLQWFSWQFVIACAIGYQLVRGARRTVTGTAVVMRWISDPAPWEPLISVLRFVLPKGVVPVPFLTAGVGFLILVTGWFALRSGRARWWKAVKDLATAAWSRRGLRDELRLTILWLVCPMVLPLLCSKLFGPMYVHRYVISASPACYLLLSLGLVRVRRIIPLAASLGLLAIWIAPGLYRYYPRPVKPPWRQALSYMQRSAVQEDAFVVVPPLKAGSRAVLDWYAPRSLHYYSVEPDGDWEKHLGQCLAGYERVWVIWDHSQPSRVLQRVDEFLRRSHTPPLTVRDEQDIGGMRLFLYTPAGSVTSRQPGPENGRLR